MTAFTYLLRREYWENRGSFFMTPVAIGGMLILVSLAISLGIGKIESDLDNEAMTAAQLVRLFALQSADMRSDYITTFLYGISTLFTFALMFVLFFYFLGSLWDDRRDRSILFWKSLPVSDLKTVVSKLTAGLILAPALALAGVMVTQIIFMGLMAVLSWAAGVGAWDTFWGPARFTEVWANLTLAYLIQGMWMLPVWGWLMLASSVARGWFRPFLVAVSVPGLAGFLDMWFNIFGRWKFEYPVFEAIADRFIGGVAPMEVKIIDGEHQVWAGIPIDDAAAPGISVSATLDKLSTPEMWWGIVVAVVFIAGAVYMRRYRDAT